jgi:hypothetical protein
MIFQNNSINLSVRVLYNPKNKTYLDERLHFAPSLHLLRTHTPCHLTGVALDTSNDSIRERFLFARFINLLDDNDLLSSMTTLKYDCNLHELDVNQAIPTIQNPPIRAPYRACTLTKVFSLYD